MTLRVGNLLELAPVIPVLVVEDAADARPMAEALVAGGLRALEVTLRTSAALDAIRAMREVPGAVVGAGTVLDPDQLDAALAAGAAFAVSPGLDEGLVRAARERSVPILPGVATASEVMRGLRLGLDCFKFFPAEAAGGAAAVKALAGPFGGVRFCPTGGITAVNAGDYLRLPSVRCVGGTWLAPDGDTDWAAIEVRARAAAGLRTA